MEFTDNDETEHVRYSFRTYVIAGYAIVAAATTISIIAIMATVFNMYFTSYAEESAESTAYLAANVISDEFTYSKSLETLDYAKLTKALRLNESEVMAVFDMAGNQIYASKENAIPDKTSGVFAGITSNGKTIGIVQVLSLIHI